MLTLAPLLSGKEIPNALNGKGQKSPRRAFIVMEEEEQEEAEASEFPTKAHTGSVVMNSGVAGNTDQACTNAARAVASSR